MGNRAIFTTPERKVALYLHWNGGRDSVEVPVGELQIGDGGWMFSHYDDWKAYPVVRFGQPEFNRISVRVKTDDGKTDVTYPDLPHVAWIDHDGDFS